MLFRLYFTSLAMLTALHLGAQASPLVNLPLFDLEPVGNFLQRYYTPAPMQLPIGFALGSVDSVFQIDTDSLGEKLVTRGYVTYTGDRLRFTYQEGELGSGSFLADTFYAPVTFRQNGLDSLARDLLVEADFFGTLLTFTVSEEILFTWQDDALQRRLVETTGNGLDPSTTDTHYNYFGDSSLVQVSYFMENSNGPFTIDSTIYQFNDSGDISAAVQYSNDEFEPLPPNPDILSSYTVTYPTPNRQHFEGFFAPSQATTVADIYIGAEVDSAVVSSTGSTSESVILYRTDDGGDPLVREYLGIGSDGSMVEYTYFYRNILVDVQEQAQLPSQLVAPNPIRSGQVLKLVDLPAQTTLAVVGLNGQRHPIAASGVGQAASFEWPDLAPGMYILTAAAPGYAPRAWKLVVAGG